MLFYRPLPPSECQKSLLKNQQAYTILWIWAYDNQWDSSMGYVIKMSEPPQGILLGQINYENPAANLTFSICKFSDVGPRPSGRTDRDTKIDLIPLQGAPFYGTRVFYYNRISLSEFLGTRSLNADLTKFPDTLSLLPLVLSQLGINLSSADVFNDQVVAGSESFTIRIKSMSLMYRGSIQVVSRRMLSQQIGTRLLDGFNKP